MRASSARYGGIPSVTSQKARTKQISFKGGINRYKDNDDISVTELYNAIDARMVRIGRYKTRKGLERFSTPVGETIDATNSSTTGASTVSVNTTQYIADKRTILASGHITKATIKVGATTATGVLYVDIRANNSGAPGTVLATTSIKRSSITSSQTNVSVYFIDAPQVTAGDIVWVVAYVQDSATGNFLISTNTSATTALVGTVEGTGWTATSYAINSSLYVTPHQPVLGLIRVNRPNGTNYTFFAAGTSLYSVNESTGATSVIQSGMSANASKYRFEVVQDALYWVNGYAKPYKYDFSSVTQLTSCPINPDLIMEHVGLLFVGREDDSELFWSNFGVYTDWTSTDFAYFLAPKTPFTLRALAKLNGVLYPFARKNKFQLLGEDNNSFTAAEAMSQRGTFSQESLVFDDDSIYYANDDGIWGFNGSTDTNLALPFLQDYLDLSNKSSVVLEKWNNRLYVFYTSNGSSQNDSCFVINLALNLYESLDRHTPIGKTFARKDSTNLFLQASNVVPAIYSAESSSNTYNNLGKPLEFELQTAFNHFEAPAQLKRIPKWRPEIVAAEGNYSLQCGYAKDMSETTTTWVDLPVGSSGVKWGSGWTWGDGTKYATSSNVLGYGLFIDGKFRRIQRKYKHVAAHEPIEFDSEMLEVHIERMM